MSDVRRFLLPDLGEGLTEAEMVAWHVAAGDTVTLNQVLAEVETEKAVVELPSPFAGTVVELLAQPGDTVAVGAPLVAVDTGGDTAEGERPNRRRCRCSWATARLVPLRAGARRRRGGDHRDHGGPPPGAERNGRPLAPHRCATQPARPGWTWRTWPATGPTASSPARIWPPIWNWNRWYRWPWARPVGRPARRCAASRSTWPKPWCAAWPRRPRPACS